MVFALMITILFEGYELFIELRSGLDLEEAIIDIIKTAFAVFCLSLPFFNIRKEYMSTRK